MKINLAKKSIASTLATVMALTVFSLFGALTPKAAAETTTKAFEVGPGTGQSTSHFRTFSVPCGQGVTVSVRLKRLGDPGTQNDVPVLIELRQPGASQGQEGPVVDTKTVTVTIPEKTISLAGAASNQPCSNPWRVRVRRAPGAPENAVTGNITLNYSSSSSSLNVEGGLISLNKGNSVIKNLGGSSGLKQGKIVITANWNHAIGPMPGPLPVRLRFDLIDPSTNSSVAYQIAYSTNEIRADKTPKLRLIYNVPTCKPGQWKLKITNNTNDDTMNIDPKVTFTPDCN
ncbi:MAG: hypothetical protein AB1757_01590 [Acidobacteriota bacterium]